MNISRKDKRLVVLEIGAGTIVPTVREMSESLINDHLTRLNTCDNDYAKLIRINPSEYDVPTGSF